MSRDKKYFLIFAGLILLIYGQSLWGGFVFDDRGIGEHQALLSSASNVIQVALYPYWTVDAGLYRPTSLLSYLFNFLIFGPGAWSFHLINLLLYFGIGVLIYLVIKSLFKSERLALYTTLIFLVLPIHTEVVANITGRLELLALFFSLLTIREAMKEWPNFWLSALWMLLAIGSKETAIATVPLVGLVILIRERGKVREIWREHKDSMMGVVFSVLVYFLLRFLVLGPDHSLGVETSIIENPLLFAAPLDRITTALSILWMYVSKTFWPANLCSDYSFDQIQVVKSFANLKTLLGLAILVGSAISTLVFLRKQPLISFASAIIFFGFITVSNIPFPIGTIAGERLFFFASLGLAVLLTLVLMRWKWVVFGLVLIYSILSFTRQSIWLSEEKLFTDAARCAPQSVLSLSNLGTVYYFRGQYEEARKALEASRAIKPMYSKGLNNLGLVYWKQGKFEEAEEMYHEALKQRYPYPGAYENLILLYLSRGDEASARRWATLLQSLQLQ